MRSLLLASSPRGFRAKPISALRRAYAGQRTNLPGDTAPRWLIVLLTAAAVAAWIVLIALLAPRLFYGSDNLRALEAVAAGRDEASSFKSGSGMKMR